MSTIEYPNEPPASLDLSTVVTRIFPSFIADWALADKAPSFEWPSFLVDQFRQIRADLEGSPRTAEHIHRILNSGA